MKNDTRYTLRLNVSIMDAGLGMGGGHLQINEEFAIEARNFIEICKLLGRFDDLAQQIRKEENR